MSAQSHVNPLYHDFVSNRLVAKGLLIRMKSSPKATGLIYSKPAIRTEHLFTTRVLIRYNQYACYTVNDFTLLAFHEA